MCLKSFAPARVASAALRSGQRTQPHALSLFLKSLREPSLQALARRFSRGFPHGAFSSRALRSPLHHGLQPASFSAGGRSTSCRGGKGGGARRKDGGKAGREGGGEKRRERAERQEGAKMAKVTTSNPRLSDSDCLGWCLSPEVAGARRSPKRCPVPRFAFGRATSANGHGSMQPFS